MSKARDVVWMYLRHNKSSTNNYGVTHGQKHNRWRRQEKDSSSRITIMAQQRTRKSTSAKVRVCRCLSMSLIDWTCVRADQHWQCPTIHQVCLIVSFSFVSLFYCRLLRICLLSLSPSSLVWSLHRWHSASIVHVLPIIWFYRCCHLCLLDVVLFVWPTICDIILSLASCVLSCLCACLSFLRVFCVQGEGRFSVYRRC